MLEGSCHCGAVRLEMARRPRRLTECDCSLCRRYAALWAYGSSRTVRVIARRKALQVYTWKQRTLEFYRCRRCGCVTHHERSRKRPGSTVAVSARMLAPETIAGIPIRRFEGASRLRGEATGEGR